MAATSTATAATVQIVVRDADGNSLPEYSVSLAPLSDPTSGAGSTPPRWSPSYWRTLYAQTDLQGKAVFSGVWVGSFAVEVRIPRGSYYIAPSENPMVPQPRVTIAREEDRVATEIVVNRGDRMSCLLQVDRDSDAGGRVDFVETVTGVRLQTSFSHGYGERLLPPGRWEVIIHPPGGVLLRDFEVDRMAMPGSGAIVQVTDGGRDVTLTWRYMATCLVRGSRNWDVGTGPPGRVVAHLVKPGPWYEEAVRRGGSIIDNISEFSPVVPEKYQMFLPDGTWRLVPEGEDLLSSEPPFIDLALAPGQDAVADFYLRARVKDDRKEPEIVVTVRSQDERPLSEARVAIWPIGGAEKGRAPLRRAKTKEDGAPSAVFRGLPKGDYVIAAGHENYTEARVEVREYEASISTPRRVDVVLGKGAVLSARAKDEKGGPLNAVRLKIDREGGPSLSLLDDPELDKLRMHRSATTDDTGRVKIWGLDGGTWRLEPVLTEFRKGTHFLRIGTGDKPADGSITLTLAESEQRDVEIRLVPAASLATRLVCADGGELPLRASIRLLPPNVDEIVVPFVLDDLKLEGRERDRLFAGPFSGGPYIILVRPEGFDRWTFAPGTEEILRAVPVAVEEGETADLGTIEIDCGPTIAVRPIVPTGVTVPDLHEGRLTVELARHMEEQAEEDCAGRETGYRNDPARQVKQRRPAEVSHAPDEARLEPCPPPRQEVARGLIRLRGVPVGKAALSLTLAHPYFIPEVVKRDGVELQLRRGGETVVPVAIDALGGAVDIAPELGAVAAVLTASDGKTRRAAAEEGRFRVGGLIPGSYRLEIFSDAECTRPLRHWKEVRIESAKTVRITGY